MDKYIYDEKNGLWYELQGDYYLPCLKISKEESGHIGVWGQRHLWYLKQYRKVRYYNLLTSGKLNGYLADIDRQAEDIYKQYLHYCYLLGYLPKHTDYIWKPKRIRPRACSGSFRR